MTEKSMSEKFFEEYRQTKSLIKELSNQIHENKKIHEELIKKRERAMSEVGSMRRIITTMIDNGWDPVEAKLKMDSNDQFNPSMWDDWMNNQYAGATGPNWVHLGVTGSSQTVGAVGATGTIYTAGSPGGGALKSHPITYNNMLDTYFDIRTT